ncbi:MAG: hypothetical protein HOP31_15720, partial [Ignavibacteria bacterium]|nr:hypothetical protein [Ignavibacteria bacterium]
MKLKTCLIILGISLFSSVSLSQWLSDVRLTNAAGPSLTNSESIAVTGDIIHVVWVDARDQNWDIYYKASGDGGVNWSPDVRLTNISSSQTAPAVVVSGPNVHVVWQDDRNGNDDIYYKRSVNGGFSWSSDIRLTTNSGGQYAPRITVTGDILHLIFIDTRNGNYEIYYKASADGGINWSADARMTNNSSFSLNPSVVVSGPDVHLVWEDDRDGNFEIYYKRSVNGGFSWTSDTRLTVAAGESKSATITAAGSIVHMAWHDVRDGNFEIYYKASGDGGVNWSPDIRITNDVMVSSWPDIFVLGPYVHLTWSDTRSGGYEIYHKLSLNGGFTWGQDTRLTFSSGAASSSSIGVSDFKANIIWCDTRDGNQEIYYKLNPNANQVGITPINSEIPDEYSLSQN